MSSAQEASWHPAAWLIGACASRAHTQVLRVEHVGADDLDLAALAVHGRETDETPSDAPPAACNEGEPHPPLELDRRSRRGHVAEARGASLGVEQLHAVTQRTCAIEGAHADQLQPVGRDEPRALRERAADEVAVRLEHALHPE